MYCHANCNYQPLLPDSSTNPLSVWKFLVSDFLQAWRKKNAFGFLWIQAVFLHGFLFCRLHVSLNRREYIRHILAGFFFFLVCVSLIVNSCRKCRGHGVVSMVTGSHVEAQQQSYSSDSFCFLTSINMSDHQGDPNKKDRMGSFRLWLCVFIPSSFYWTW